MSVDLQESLGIEPARIALDEFRATQDEFTEFFGDVFDQLQGLSLELFARHKYLAAGTEQKSESEETLVHFREEFQHSIEELQRLHGQFQVDRQEVQGSWAEIRAGYQQFLDDYVELREGFRQVAGEFAGIQQDRQHAQHDLHELFAHVEGQLSRLTTLTTELAAAHARPAQDAEIAEILDHSRQQQAEALCEQRRLAGQQQADWLQQRAALEAGLDAMRRYAEEQVEALCEQRRLAGQQQTELADELRRMRILLEALATRNHDEAIPPDAIVPPRLVDRSVLGSVLAEFEMPQPDIGFRQSNRNLELYPDDKTFPDY